MPEGAGGGQARQSREVSSNVRFADYAGTQACEPCHASHVRSFLQSPMHNMTRTVGPGNLSARAAAGSPPVTEAQLRGPFDGTTFRFKGDEARLEMVSGARFLTVRSERFGSATYRITRVIGGHYREDYAGVPVAGPRVDAKVIGDPNEELVLPVSWVFASRSLRYKGYSVMVKERPGLRAGPVWNRTCIFCHNTVPYLSAVLGALAGPAAKPYQGVVVDPTLPSGKRAEYVVTDPHVLRAALEDELERLGANQRAPTLLETLAATRSRFRSEHLVEVGIGCESCHLGSAEHVREPARLPSFEPRSASFEVRLPGSPPPGSAERRAANINRTCARCHQVLFTGYEHTWEGGARDRNPGGSNINSGEARNMLLGACVTRLSCAECHEPHAKDATASLRALEGRAEDRLCTRCHAKYETDDALERHAHHRAGSSGARCLSCHMPKKTMSLDGELSRYHRIGSPTDPDRVLLDRPLECALCHAGASVEKLVSSMEAWWGKSYDRDALAKLYGQLDANVLLSTAERGKPHEQGVAFHALGRARDRAAVPLLARGLRHPIPLVRGYAKRALERIRGAPAPIDLDADEASIEAQANAWLSR